MKIIIDDNTTLELVDLKHGPEIYDLVSSSRNYFREWLPWVDAMHSVEFIRNYILGSNERNREGNEYEYVILTGDKVTGRIGVHKIDHQNRIGEIGYWIGKDQQGKGIATTCCKRLVDFCFDELNLNRIEIKCGTGNLKSRKVPERLGFTFEGILRQGEWVHDKFIDLRLYSLLKAERT